MTNQVQDGGATVGDRPLASTTVVVTRPEDRPEGLSRRLRSLGARVLEHPTIVLRDPDDVASLRRAAAALDSYDWLIFTSPAGPRQLVSHGPRGASPGGEGLRTAAIGPATAEAAREAGFTVDIVPEEYRAEALAAAIRAAAGPGDDPDRPLAGQRVLLPRADRARDVLPRRLERAGAVVDEVTAYVTERPDAEALRGLRRAVSAGEVDWLTFTASSTVRHYVELMGPETGGARVAAIGPITAGTARELGLRVDAVADEYTVDGLVRALVSSVRRQPAGGA